MKKVFLLFSLGLSYSCFGNWYQKLKDARANAAELVEAELVVYDALEEAEKPWAAGVADLDQWSLTLDNPRDVWKVYRISDLTNDN